MDYDFSTLSHTAFEDLTRDLLGRALGIRFEGFAEGRDDGMDGRHATADGDIILQAKHFNRSGFTGLKAKMKTERAKIDALQPKRYILATSATLTPANKKALAEIIGPALQGPGDIFGPQDLNALLLQHSDIEIAHQALWRQSSAVMNLHRHPDLQGQRRRPADLYRRRHRQSRRRLACQPMGRTHALELDAAGR